MEATKNLYDESSTLTPERVPTRALQVTMDAVNKLGWNPIDEDPIPPTMFEEVAPRLEMPEKWGGLIPETVESTKETLSDITKFLVGSPELGPLVQPDPFFGSNPPRAVRPPQTPDGLFLSEIGTSGIPDEGLRILQEDFLDYGNFSEDVDGYLWPTPR